MELLLLDGGGLGRRKGRKGLRGGSFWQDNADSLGGLINTHRNPLAVDAGMADRMNVPVAISAQVQNGNPTQSLPAHVLQSIVPPFGQGGGAKRRGAAKQRR